MNKIKSLLNNDNWYDYPQIYNSFSFAEDTDKKCIEVVKNKIINDKIIITNPIDLGTGTGKIYDQLLKEINFEGHVWLIENNKNMLDFIKEKYKGNNEIKIINNSISDFRIENQISNFIISSFGFPSCMYDANKTLEELKNVYENLLNDGVFITIGWNEKWNDEVSDMWKRYTYKKFDDNLMGARNCGLNWLENDINTSLKFKNIKEKNCILNNLFGDIIELDSNKLEFKLNMGVTFNTKEELKNIIKNLEKHYERN